MVKLNRGHLYAWGFGIFLGMMIFMFLGIYVNLEYESQFPYIVLIGELGVFGLITINSLINLELYQQMTAKRG